jgi:hypothetical protein
MDKAPLVTFGVIGVGYGVFIYYVLPLSLISLDLSLLLDMFFVILVGMIGGLATLAFNFQSPIELLTLKLLLCWETTSMQSLVRKNLTAHGKRNKLTAMVYTLTLACVLCLVITA